MELASVLDDCIQQLRAGEGVASCLARHPEHTAELAPMLAAAGTLCALSGARLPEAKRLRAKVALRQIVAERSSGPSRLAWMPVLRGTRGLAMAVVAGALLFSALTVSVVAASQPGDLSYPLRVAVERAPILLQRAPAGRANAELAVADRRLADLRAHLTEAGQADATAVEALLAGDEAAARAAIGLSRDKRAQVADRMIAHAQALADLAQVAPEPQVAQALSLAAERAFALADQVHSGVPPSAGSQPQATPDPTGEPGGAPSPAETATPMASAEPPPSLQTPVETATERPSTQRPTITYEPTREAESSPTNVPEGPTMTSTPVLPWRHPTQTRLPRTATPRLSPPSNETPRATRLEPHPSQTEQPRAATPLPSAENLPRATTSEPYPTEQAPAATPESSPVAVTPRMPGPGPQPMETPRPRQTRLPGPPLGGTPHPTWPGPVSTDAASSPGSVTQEPVFWQKTGSSGSTAMPSLPPAEEVERWINNRSRDGS